MKSIISLKQLIIASAILIGVQYGYSQVGIGTADPNDNSSLDLGQTDKGLLVNRLTTAQRTITLQPNLGLAEKGLIVFDSDLDQFMFWDGTQWIAVTSGSLSGTGNEGNVAIWGPANVITDNSNLFWSDAMSRLGVNNNAPEASLSIGGSDDIALEIKSGDDSQVSEHL